MQWRNDLPTTWDEAPDDPPATAGTELEIVAVNGGYVARPAEAPEDGCVGTNSLYSDTALEIGGNQAERPSQ